MRQSVRDNFVAFTRTFEGHVLNFYLDLHIPDPLVSIGDGDLVDPISMALDLPMVWPDGHAATRDEIAVAWHAVKGRPDLANDGWRAFLSLTPLRLTEDGVAELVRRRLDANDVFLRARFPAWDSWCSDAQLGMHSIAWAAGAGVYMPHLQAALEASPPRFDVACGPDGDPNTILACRGEAWLHDSTLLSAPGVSPVVERITNPGLRDRNRATKVCFANAARVQLDGLDLERLYWPNTTAQAAA